MKKKKTISISLSKETIDKLQKKAEELNVSLSSLVELILNNKIKL